MRLILICHAATAAVRAAAFPEDEPLEPAGRAAAHALGPSLPAKRFALASPSLRTRETALALGLDAVADSGLRDMDYGDWRGSTFEEIEAREPAGIAAWMSDPSAAPHGGESISDLCRRVATWLGNMPSDRTTTIAVTHPAVVRAAIVSVLAAPVTSFWRVDAGPLCSVDLRGRAGAWTLRAIVDPHSGRRQAKAET